MTRTTALLLVSALCVLGACNYDHLTETGSRRPTPETCGGCHVEVHREWSASAHATAFSGATYTSLTAGHDFDSCAGCHVPDSVWRPGPVAARAVQQAHGVDCVACHLDQGALVGPFEGVGLVQPHPVRSDRPVYLQSDLCGRCHEGTFRQWSEAAAREPDGRPKRTCQQCHMPAVERTLTQATGVASEIIVAAESEHPQRRHRFDLEVVRGFENAAELRFEEAAGALDLVLTNRLPHALPTGDFGPRNIEARLEYRDAEGALLGSEKAAWRVRTGTAVPAFGTDRRRLAPPTGTRIANALLVRLASPTTSEEFELARAAWRQP